MTAVVRSEPTVDGSQLESPTWVTSFAGMPRTVNVRRCRLEVVAGPDAGKKIELAQSSIMIGRTGADLTINDPKVSGLHCELRLQSDGYRVRDLGSTNGTHVKGVRVVDGFIPPGATIQIGKSAIVFDPLDDSVTVPLWHEARLHSLIGGSRTEPDRGQFRNQPPTAGTRSSRSSRSSPAATKPGRSSQRCHVPQTAGTSRLRSVDAGQDPDRGIIGDRGQAAEQGLVVRHRDQVPLERRGEVPAPGDSHAFGQRTPVAPCVGIDPVR